MAGTCGYGEGLSGSINAGNFLTSCRVYWLDFNLFIPAVLTENILKV